MEYMLETKNYLYLFTFIIVLRRSKEKSYRKNPGVSGTTQPLAPRRVPESPTPTLIVGLYSFR
jgi:hypothetical protein